jgi:hypothetical protein
MGDLTDFIDECNEHKMPLEDFRGIFCICCFQVECTRSQAGKAKFDQRVSTWKERLFTQVPRLDPEDPRYALITSQRFITLDTGRAPEIEGSWIDPLTVEASPRIEDAPMLVLPPTDRDNTTLIKPALKGQVPVQMVQANAADQSGKVLSGGVTKAPVQPARDPWGVPATSKETIVPSGARVRLRSSGGV